MGWVRASALVGVCNKEVEEEGDRGDNKEEEGVEVASPTRFGGVIPRLV